MITTSPEMRERYKSAKTLGTKLALRQDWAKGEYHMFVETRTHASEFEKSNDTTGTWMSLNRIAVEEGGGEVGMKAAINYCLRAAREGPQWASYNEWTQQASYKYTVRREKESNKETWSKTQQWLNQKGDAQKPTAGRPGKVKMPKCLEKSLKPSGPVWQKSPEGPHGLGNSKTTRASGGASGELSQSV